MVEVRVSGAAAPLAPLLLQGTLGALRAQVQRGERHLVPLLHVLRLRRHPRHRRLELCHQLAGRAVVPARLVRVRVGVGVGVGVRVGIRVRVSGQWSGVSGQWPVVSGQWLGSGLGLARLQPVLHRLRATLLGGGRLRLRG